MADDRDSKLFTGPALIQASCVPLDNGAFGLVLVTATDRSHAILVGQGQAAPNVHRLLVTPEMLAHLAQQVGQAQMAAESLISHGGKPN